MKTGVVIGRFRPFHRGHKALIQHALDHNDRVVIFIGSYLEARSRRNPWTCGEVVDMIRASFPFPDSQKLGFTYLEDTLYRDTGWVERVKERLDVLGPVKLYGYKKDTSSEYLNWFGDIFEEVQTGISYDATTARLQYFSDNVDAWLKASGDVLPPKTIEFLSEWKNTKHYKEVRDMHKQHMDYVATYGPGPHLAADAVVYDKATGEALLIERKDGKVAFPGGFLGHGETLEQCAKRELFEETGFTIPPELKADFVLTADAPYRDNRARIISLVHFYFCDSTITQNSDIRAGDDAETAFWYPIKEISMFQNWFADHRHLANYLGTLING